MISTTNSATRSKRSGLSRRQRRRANFLRRPRVEVLEGRELLAAHVFHVTNTNDAGEGSLRDAIIQANENDGTDTIRFSRGARGEIALSSELTITDDLIIKGPGAKKLSISGQDITRVFRVDANPSQVFGAPMDESGDLIPLEVEIQDLTVKDGLATNAPGFPAETIVEEEGEEVRVPLFPGFAFGGGLYNRGGDVTLKGVHMNDNQAGSPVLPIVGSGVDAEFNYDTGEYSSDGPGNSNLGPIEVTGRVTEIIPIGGNPTPSPGEDLLIATFSGAQTITDANGDELKGEIAGTVVITLNAESKFEGRWEAEFTIDPDTSTGRFAGANSKVDIVAINPPGFDPSETIYPFDWEINGAIDQPTALGAGGAIGNEFGGSVTVHRGKFDDNMALGAIIGVGGAVSQDVGPTENGLATKSPSYSISHSSFTDNKAKALFTDPVLAGDFGPFAGYALGGAILNVAGTVSVGHSSFTGNEAHSGDGIEGNSAGSAVGGAIFSDDFSPFIDPAAAGELGMPPGRNSFLDVHNSRFIGNAAKGGMGSESGDGGSAEGGAIGVSIAFLKESASLRHNAFLDNHAYGGDGGTNGGNGGRAVGGAVAAIAGADVEAIANRFVGNGAHGGDGGPGADGGEARGGAIGLAPIITSDGSDAFDPLTPRIDVVRGIFFHNVAKGGNGGAGGSGGNGLGGAIGLSDGAEANVHRSLIKRNTAKGGNGLEGGDGGNGQGGGIYNGDSTASLSRSIVFANLAKGGSGDNDGLGQGGGLFSDGSFTIERSLIRHNRASDDGDNVFGLLF
jgi:hypothetical protein